MTKTDISGAEGRPYPNCNLKQKEQPNWAPDFAIHGLPPLFLASKGWFIIEENTKEEQEEETCPKFNYQLRNEDTAESSGDLKQYPIKWKVKPFEKLP